MPNPLLDVIRQPFSDSHATELKMNGNDRGARLESGLELHRTSNEPSGEHQLENVAAFPDRAEDLLLADVL